MLKNFQDLKSQWDHSFFKAIIAPKIDKNNNNNKEKGLHQYGNDVHQMAQNLIQEDMDSVIDPEYQSYIANDQEEKIPEYPVQFSQNKKMVAIWYESKELITSTLRKHNLMTQEEKEEAS